MPFFRDSISTPSIYFDRNIVIQQINSFMKRDNIIYSYPNHFAILS